MSCKKSGGKTSDGDVKSKIIGKWAFLKNVNHSFVDGQSETEVENDSPGNYFEFRSDGTVTAALDDGKGDGTWQLVNGKMRFHFEDDSFDGIDFDIVEITDSVFTLYAKQVSGPDYYETTMYMSQSGDQDPGSLYDVKANQKIFIDGKATYTGQKIQFGVNYDPSTKLFIITGGSPNNAWPSVGFNFFLTTSMKVGDIILLRVPQKHVDKYGWGRYMEALGATNDFWTEDSDYSGSMTITQFNSKTRIFSATFKFKGVARDQYGKYLGERTVSGGLETIYFVDATNGKWK